MSIENLYALSKNMKPVDLVEEIEKEYRGLDIYLVMAKIGEKFMLDQQYYKMLQYYEYAINGIELSINSEGINSWKLFNLILVLEKSHRFLAVIEKCNLFIGLYKYSSLKNTIEGILLRCKAKQRLYESYFLLLKSQYKFSVHNDKNAFIEKKNCESINEIEKIKVSIKKYLKYIED